VGLMAYGQLLNGPNFDEVSRVQYAAGIFNGNRNGFLARQDGKFLSAYVNAHPFGEWRDSLLENFNIGGSTTYALNLIEYNAGYGVGIGSGSFGNVIQNDIIDLNSSNGVLLAGDSGDSVVDCTIEANGAWGILDAGSNNYLADNTLANNVDGSVGY